MLSDSIEGTFSTLSVYPFKALIVKLFKLRYAAIVVAHHVISSRFKSANIVVIVAGNLLLQSTEKAIDLVSSGIYAVGEPLEGHVSVS